MGSANGSGRDNDPDTTSRGGSGILTLAAAPIGRAEDAPPRLAAELATADVIAAEDTRRLRQLAATLNVTIAGRVISYYDVIETRRAEQLAAELAAGKNVLVVTDAGMPGIPASVTTRTFFPAASSAVSCSARRVSITS